MMDTRQAWVNGRFVPWNEARAHLLSHSFARGSAIFEVIGFHATPSGPAVFRLRDHVGRLLKSAAFLEMQLPADGPAICRAVTETVRQSGLSQGLLKIMAYYPQVALDIQPPAAPLDLAVFALEASQDAHDPGASFEKGTTAGIARWRKLDPETIPLEAKAAANYLNGMVARLDARKRGFQDALLLDTQGFVAEGPTESVFAVKEGVLMTPCLGTVLDSITRRSILEAAGPLGLKTFEGRLRPERLFEADEVFFANTPFKVMPVRQLEHREFSPVPGPVQTRLARFFERVTRGDEPEFSHWLHPA